MNDNQKWTTEPWLDAGTGVVVMNGESMEPILMAQIVDHDNYEAGVACANVARAVSCVNAMQGIRNPAAVREVIEAAQAASDWDWSGLGSMLNHCDWVPALADIERLEKALAALDAEESK